MGSRAAEQSTRSFSDFARDVEPRLRQALVARFGTTVGREAAVDALAYGWEHWQRLSRLDNPAGYLYRVGQTRARRSVGRKQPTFPATPEHHEHWVEPGLPAALESLSERQRTAVVLVHSFEWTQKEVAEVLGLSATTVQKHLERGLAKLRAALEVDDDA